MDVLRHSRFGDYAMLHRYRGPIIATLVLLMMIVALQNTEPTETRILFFSFTMPSALLLFTAALLGFAVGVLSSLRFRR
jgi:uncharacterized integral membrane protein